jgi:hypothetical protein
MVQTYGSEEMKAFCCNCEKVTVHRYESFGKQEPKSNTGGFISGLLEVVAGLLMSDAPTGDYKCKVCGTNLHTPDHLD